MANRAFLECDTAWKRLKTASCAALAATAGAESIYA